MQLPLAVTVNKRLLRRHKQHHCIIVLWSDATLIYDSDASIAIHDVCDNNNNVMAIADIDTELQRMKGRMHD